MAEASDLRSLFDTAGVGGGGSAGAGSIKSPKSPSSKSPSPNSLKSAVNAPPILPPLAYPPAPKSPSSFSTGARISGVVVVLCSASSTPSGKEPRLTTSNCNAARSLPFMILSPPVTYPINFQNKPLARGCCFFEVG